MLLSIRFDDIRWTTLEALSQYIVSYYGSWAEVPESHPDIAVVERLCGHNGNHYVEVNGMVSVRGHDLVTLQEPDGSTFQVSEDEACSNPSYNHLDWVEPEETQAYWNRVHDAH